MPRIGIPRYCLEFTELLVSLAKNRCTGAMLMELEAIAIPGAAALFLPRGDLEIAREREIVPNAGVELVCCHANRQNVPAGTGCVMP